MSKPSKIGNDANKSSGKRKLTEDEKELWHQVQKTITPNESRNIDSENWLEEFENSNSNSETVKTPQPQLPTPSFLDPYIPPISTPSHDNAGNIDDKTARKLLKGRLSIEARIDLHGLTQQQAHQRLQGFLRNCYENGNRIVLVITGKGRTSGGILRTAVPHWLKEPHLSVFVSGYRVSHITHGGEGALYVRLRKQNKR